MKRVFLAALLVLFSGAGCAEIEINGGGKEEGCSASVKLHYLESDPFTRTQSILDEMLVRDVNVYVADGAGEVVYQNYFSSANAVTEPFEISKGDKYKVYVLANWGERLLVADMQELHNIKYTADDLTSLSNEKCADILVGTVENVEFPLPGDELGVEMRRILAGICIKCDFSQVDESLSIEPVKVRIRNVPVATTLFADNVPASVEEVGEGAVFYGEDLGDLEVSGVEFYTFENRQGYVGDASDNKQKTYMLTELGLKVSACVEIECSVVSDTRRGTLLYRFFLGTDHTNCNVLRNELQTITVKFKGQVSQDENTLNVDNSALGYRVEFMTVSPSSLQFTSSAQSTRQCVVTVYPENAVDKSVVWSTTDAKVATVDQSGLITTRGTGKCYIRATSVDCPHIYTQVNVKVYNYNGG